MLGRNWPFATPTRIYQQILDKKYSQPQNIFNVRVQNVLKDYDAIVCQLLSFMNGPIEKLELDTSTESGADF